MRAAHILAILLLQAGACSADDDDTDDAAAEIISVSPDSDFETECTIAAQRDGRTAVAFMARDVETTDWFGSERIGLTLSPAGHGSWSTPVSIPSDDLAYVDPGLSPRPDAGFTLVWLELGVRILTADVGVVEDDVLGATSPVVEAGAEDDLDKPVVITTPDQATLVLFANASSLQGARREEEGGAWERTTIAPAGASTVNGPTPCALPDGKIWVGYLEIGDVESALRLAGSDDDGRTWSDPVLLSEPGERIALDPPSCAVVGDELWVAYGTTDDVVIDFETFEFGKLSAIPVLRIGPDGEVRDRLDAMDHDASRYAQHPRVVASEGAEPRVALLYYAGQDDGDAAGSLRIVRASGDGSTFGASEAVASPIRFVQRWGGDEFVGDYFGAVWQAGEIRVCYGDNADGAGHIAYRTIPL